MSRRTSGVTLVELLIVMAILVGVLAATLGFVANSNQLHQAQVRVSDRQLATDNAVQLLVYEVGLAGYKGVDEDAPTRSFGGTGNTLVVQKGDGPGAPDTVTVRYFEDRYTHGGGLVENVVRFSVDIENGQLVREPDGEDAQAIIDGVSNMKVVQYLRRDGVRVEANDSSVPVPSNLAALNVEITFVDGKVWRFPIALNNPQVAQVN